MAELSKQMTRDDVLSQIRQNHSQFNALLNQIVAAGFANNPIQNHWTLKDILAHLAAWERLEADWMQSLIRSERPYLYTPGFEQDENDFNKRCETYHRYNAHILDICKGQPFDEVLSGFRKSQQEILDAVASLPDHAFTDPNYLFWLALEAPRAAWIPVPVCSHEHYMDHGRWLRHWLDQHK